MKNFKKICVFVISATMVFSIVGCKKSEEKLAEAVGTEVSTDISVEDRIKETNAKMADVKSMNSHIVMEIDMTAAEDLVSTVTTMDIVSFTSPLKMKADMQMEMNVEGAEAQKISIYVDEVDGKAIMYFTDGTQWYSQEMPAEALAQYDTKGSITGYLQGFSDYKETGTEKINGKDVVKIEGIVSGDSLKQAIENSGAVGDLQTTLNMDEEAVSSLYSDLGDTNMSIWIDKESSYPVKYEIDMAAVMQKLITGIAEASNVTTEDVNMGFTKFKITMTASDFNNAVDFEIPAEAKR